MKVALVETVSPRHECVNKDFMGGYGWAFKVGDSLPARAIEWVKRWGERLPIMSFGYLAAIFARAGHEVCYTNGVVPDADLALVYATMVDHGVDLAIARRYRAETRARVLFTGPFEGLVDSPDVKDLDRLPFPDWSCFPVHSYSYFPALRQRPFLPVLSSRGCPYTCEYCPYEIIKWRPRSVDNVLDELAYLRARHGLRAFLFRDPIFTLSRRRVVDLVEGMMRRDYRFRWACETRMDCLDVELLGLLRDAGLRVINVAVESASEAVLKGVARKPIPVEHQERILAACDRLGIRATVFYVLGFPEDTRESIEATIGYAKRLNSHVAQFFVYTPFPGTALYERVKGDIAVDDWEKFDCYTPVVRHPLLAPEEILRLKERAFVGY
ncbi:MAG: radical SAM protein, partial [Candidatus Rokubacteria bacterium]|nr:radical SAM protein [Candidatus Rokubacteria bacterium]